MKRDNNQVVSVLRSREYTDQEIVSGITAGVLTAGEALVEKYGVSIDKRVWRLLGADNEHSDAVQTVYKTIIQSIHKLKDPKALPDWIKKVTVNVVRNEIRHRKIRRIVMFVPDPEKELSDTTDLDAQLRVHRAFAIIDTMNNDDRIAFVMRYMEGTSFKDIASAMGCSLSTIKRRAPRAREIFLKKAMRDPILASLVREEGNDD